MSSRIIQTRDEVVIVTRRRREDAEEVQVVTFRSKPEEPILRERLGSRWDYSPEPSEDRPLPLSRLDRWRLDPQD